MSNNIYADTSSNIVLKILKRMSYSSFNEAFFNKFRVSFKSSKIILSGQILVKECIEFDSRKKILKRNRIPEKDISIMQDELKRLFPSFQKIKAKSFDGQHICGGQRMLDSKNLQNILESSKLKILGSPSNFELNAFHHTQALINKIQNND